MTIHSTQYTYNAGKNLNPCATEHGVTSHTQRVGGWSPILTMEGATPTYVEAVAVDKGRIVYAGNRAEAMKLKGTATRLKNLDGTARRRGRTAWRTTLFLLPR